MEERLGEHMVLRLQDESFPLSTDSMLLASFVRLRKGERVADLGSGCGTLGLLLCARWKDCRVEGIELQELPHRRALENIAHNALESRLSSQLGDVRQVRSLYAPGSFSAVVSNPPYFPAGSGKTSTRQSIARSEETLSLGELCQSAAWLLPTGGRFFLVHRPERLCDVLCALRQSGLEPKRLQWVRHKADAPLCLFLLEAVRGGKPGLCYEKDLIEFDPDGSPTEAYRTAYDYGGRL